MNVSNAFSVNDSVIDTAEFGTVNMASILENYETLISYGAKSKFR